VVDTAESEVAFSFAVKENKVFITTNLKVFNQKGGVPRGCLHYQETPYSKIILLFINPLDQLKAMQEYFQF
jgi:hypothetical protein